MDYLSGKMPSLIGFLRVRRGRPGLRKRLDAHAFVASVEADVIAVDEKTLECLAAACGLHHQTPRLAGRLHRLRPEHAATGGGRRTETGPCSSLHVWPPPHRCGRARGWVCARRCRDSELPGWPSWERLHR